MSVIGMLRQLRADLIFRVADDTLRTGTGRRHSRPQVRLRVPNLFSVRRSQWPEGVRGEAS